ncbi:MAG: HAD family hydrolase [Propionivibrio sp.]|jgi:HAD superfamily hydrolase (TIGR01490 family)|uniref:histidinol-phosphatase n=1 Tax=Propionivibrio sp. TaxID=2212460 RepID=UPI001B793F7C|nr:HAD family hydrolase [Propionivibrio sp.]MBP7203412.1 HAD family hydrolase [Propionivibrio sp.]
MQLALFDLDHTLLTGDSDYEWTQYLVSKGIVDRTTHEARNAEFYEQYKAGTMDIHEFLDFQLRPLADHTRADLEAWHADFMETQIRPRLSQKARELVRKHLDAGDICAMVTATNSFVTGPIARELGIPHLIATIPAQENGRFTGKPRGLPSFREGKIARVDAWLESMGLWWNNFQRSWFYSDSHNDLPLLLRVTDPVVVDPDATLRAYAENAGWPTLSIHA